MILRIRTSKSFRVACLTLALTIFFEIVAPNQVWALTGGPAQPEFGSFTPIGTSDMVDLSSGDMNYNIPLLDVGGYPVNMSYASNIGMDDEASWVGLGWNLSIGQINRNVRGIPDDFSGDQLRYENHMKKNITVGGSVKVQPAVFGVEYGGQATSSNGEEDPGVNVSLGMAVTYNNYSGLTMSPSVGASIDIGQNVSVGLNIQSTSEGMCIAPSMSLHAKKGTKDNFVNSLTGTVGLSFNSRQGLTATTLGLSSKNKVGVADNGDDMYVRGSMGSTISYTDQLYTPTKRVGMVTGSFTFNGAVGGEVWGVEGQVQVNAYGTVMEVRPEERNKLVRSFGYEYTERADDYAVLDFNREKDDAFSVNKTNLAVTNYTYDIYSVNGQGVSGMYRPYRNQVGYVFDARVDDISNSSTLGIELGAGNSVHVGVDLESVTSFSHSGVWQNQNTLIDYLRENYSYNPKYEKVHHKNVGDLSTDKDLPAMLAATGNYQPARVELGTTPYYRTAKNNYLVKHQTPGLPNYGVGVNAPIKRTQRLMRNQAIFNIKKSEIAHGEGPLSYGQQYTLPAGAKGHHTAEVQIVRNDGARYVYGLPVYNTKKVEATFAVDGTGDCATGLVSYSPNGLSNPTSLPNDQYLNKVTTPAYVHTHLLTSVLSTDYQDRTGNGPSSDDFGSYTEFVYQKPSGGISYKWRVPYERNMGTHNEGLKTEPTDDQANYIYGEKELYYVHMIKTKTHIAVFNISERQDAQGVDNEHGAVPNSDVQFSKMYKLDSIQLYSVEEYYHLNGTVDMNAIPMKTVHFEYNYDLCRGVPNNNINGDLAENELSNEGGKLTLKKVYFTYRNSKMGKYTPYEFDYGNVANQDVNPDYNIKAYDSWGNYLRNTANTSCTNSGNPSPAEFPYTNQDTDVQNKWSSAWTLKGIKLPSGGHISIEYESDRYSHVQDKEAQRMFMVRGAGLSPNGSSVLGAQAEGAPLFSDGIIEQQAKYLYVEVDPTESTTASSADLLKRFFSDPDAPIHFRFLMNMTQLGGESGHDDEAFFDYVTGYFELDNSSDLSVFQYGTKRYLSVPMRHVQLDDSGSSNRNPISKAGWHFGRKYLSEHVYSLEPNGEQDQGASETIEQIVQDIFGPTTINNLVEVFKGPNGALEDKRIARRFITTKSWIRLREADGEKLGGGSRVARVKMSDEWAEQMIENNPSAYTTMEYGQEYNYETTSGKTSGVAAYEPVGNKENPHVQPIFHEVKLLLAPNEHNFVEGPFGESFYPNPQVTYARVTVRNLQGGTAPNAQATLKRSHKTGKVVHEFYTTRDYPTIVDKTQLKPEEDKNNAFANFLHLNAKKHIYGSQGYVIHLNDMNGKQKAQWVYAEGQDEPISGVEYKYDNHASTPGGTPAQNPSVNKGRLDNEVTVINPQGVISKKTIGVEVDVVNDFRENKSKTVVIGVNTNIAGFLAALFPAVVPIPLPDMTVNEDQMRTVVTTKVINTFGILKETIAHDAGAKVYTRNLAWDESTGEVLVTETIDEFNDKYYTLNYPAHWYYKGMAQASMNLGLTGTLVPLGGGNYQLQNLPSNTQAEDYLIPGDELVVGSGRYWVGEVSGAQFSLKDVNWSNALFASPQNFKVFRSGHRNLQSAGIMNVTLMRNPLLNSAGDLLTSLSGTSYLSANTGGGATQNDWNLWKIINAGAVDYSDDWPAGCECAVNDPDGIRNPYVNNELGVWRTKSSRTYLSGRKYDSSPTPRRDGFFLKFSPMYWVNGTGVWDQNVTNWTFVAEVTEYSPYGFELENKDALIRHSAAQYGYNNTFPVAVGANSEYREIGFDGFEDYNFDGCPYDAHFRYDAEVHPEPVGESNVSEKYSHTGKYSLRVGSGKRATMSKKLDCEN